MAGESDFPFRLLAGVRCRWGWFGDLRSAQSRGRDRATTRGRDTCVTAVGRALSQQVGKRCSNRFAGARVAVEYGELALWQAVWPEPLETVGAEVGERNQVHGKSPELRVESPEPEERQESQSTRGETTKCPHKGEEKKHGARGRKNGRRPGLTEQHAVRQWYPAVGSGTTGTLETCRHTGEAMSI